MRVFVTGASGFIGSAIVQQLLEAKHQVLGLARSDASAKSLSEAGADVHRGSLDDLESLKSGATQCDGVIHVAFIHDFKDYVAACNTDKLAIEALGSALAGTGKPLVVASGTLGLSGPEMGTEDDAGDTSAAGAPRILASESALAWEAKDVRASVVRLSPTVHGDGDRGFVTGLIATARAKGVSAYIGDGLNRWPAVHRFDAASLFVLALEKGIAGSRYHGAADEGVLIKDIAELIARKLKVPVVSKTPEEAAEHFGFLGFVLGRDNPTSSKLTRERLGWNPTHPSLLADLENGTYFEPGVKPVVGVLSSS